MYVDDNHSPTYVVEKHAEECHLNDRTSVKN